MLIGLIVNLLIVAGVLYGYWYLNTEEIEKPESEDENYWGI